MHCLSLILGDENWDDHDRSHKTAARDFARNYLGLADKNGVVITFGDNDTFPLWYIQEVEGFRTDVRILNYTLSGMHWYVDQLYNKLYESDPLPFTLPRDMYGLGHEIFVLNPDGPRMEVTDALNMLVQNRNRLVRKERGDDSVAYLPTNKFKISLDKEKLVANGIISANDTSIVPDYIPFDINISRGYLIRNEMMILDILGTNHFERAISIMNPGYIRDVFPVIDQYSIDDGMLSLIVPYRVNGNQYRYTARTKDYFLNGMRQEDGSYKPLEWGNLNKDIYVDPVSKNMGDVQRQSFIMLSQQLLEEGDTVSARKALQLREEFFPVSNFPNDRFALMMVYTYSHAGEPAKAYEILCDVFDYYMQQMNYAKSFPTSKAKDVERMLADAYYFLYQVVTLRQHSAYSRSPFNGMPEIVLSQAGEEAFKAANGDNAARLKAIDDFAASSTYTQEVLPYVNR